MHQRCIVGRYSSNRCVRMKFLVCAIVLGVVCLDALADGAEEPVSPPNLEDVSKIANGEAFALECLIESGLKLDSLASLSASDLDANGNKIKCLVKCFFEKTGFMDKDGQLQEKTIVEQLSKFMPRDRIEALVQNCNFQEADACETAYKVTECYFQNKAGLF
ncbi:general odorant-binding protein 56d-like [Anopheles stephensi]|uniref:general odorant-binding protein 56d-like n=1 Tax=Anopheles stephensi TaxID=30069 RepID=UPI0016589048|nr:general odorant-binding protein 56d-like [Anopheles stephensi]